MPTLDENLSILVDADLNKWQTKIRQVEQTATRLDNKVITVKLDAQNPFDKRDPLSGKFISQDQRMIEERLSKMDQGKYTTKYDPMYDSMVKVEKQAKATTNTVENMHNNFLAGAGKVSRAFGLIAVAIKGTDLATDLWNGNIDKVQEALRNLPFGIGTLVSAVESLREKWGLMPAYVAEHKQQIKETEQYYQAMEKRVERYVSLHGKMKSENESMLERNREMWAGDDPAKRTQLVQQRMNEQIAKGESEYGAKIKGGWFSEFEKKQLEKDFQQRQNLIRANASLEIGKIQDQQKEAADKKKQAALDAENNIRVLQSELYEKELQAQGKALDAQVESITRSYGEKIRVAADGEKAILAAMRDADIEAAKQDDAKAKERLKAADESDKEREQKRLAAEASKAADKEQRRAKSVFDLFGKEASTTALQMEAGTRLSGEGMREQIASARERAMTLAGPALEYLKKIMDNTAGPQVATVV